MVSYAYAMISNEGAGPGACPGEVSGAGNSKFDEQLMFSKFKGDFTDSELTELRSVRINKYDSKFITTCLRMLYKENLKVLANRTVEFPSGSKTPLTPKKKNLIKAIYQERLLLVPPNEYPIRYSKLNIHLKNAIRNTVILNE